MDKLQGILSLPFSRKFILSLVIPLLVLINKKCNLGLSDQDIMVAASGLVAAILGIAIEDSKK